MDRLDDAVAAYERALALAPRDESALRGIAEAHIRTGRRTDAAATLDGWPTRSTRAGRLADATDAARRALELAESRARRHTGRNVRRPAPGRVSGDEVAQRALDQALAGAGAGRSGRRGARRRGSCGGGGAEPAPEAGAPELERSCAGANRSRRPSSSPRTRSRAGRRAEPEPEPEPVAEPTGLGIALGAAAEAALHAGDITAAHDGLLAAARAHRRAGRLSAAVDACYLAIVSPPPTRTSTCCWPSCTSIRAGGSRPPTSSSSSAARRPRRGCGEPRDRSSSRAAMSPRRRSLSVARTRGAVEVQLGQQEVEVRVGRGETDSEVAGVHGSPRRQPAAAAGAPRGLRDVAA